MGWGGVGVGGANFSVRKRKSSPDDFVDAIALITS